MRNLRIILYILALVPLLSGIPEIIVGVESQNLFGAEIATEGLGNPFLESQFRYIATMWFSIGFFILLFSSDLKRYGQALNVLLVFAMLGGVTRLFTFAQFGFPEDQFAAFWISAAAAVEVLFVPVVIYMNWRMMQNNYE